MGKNLMACMLAKIFFFLIVFSRSMRDHENITPVDKYVIDFVKNLRVTKNLTQEDIGNIIGVSRSFIRDVEGNKNRAKFNINHINALADYFGMSPRTFLPEKAFPIDGPPKEKSSNTKRLAKKSKKKTKKQETGF